MGSPAESYEAAFVPVLFAPWASVLVDLARPQPGERILDVACGTGIAARHAARRLAANGEVVGLDLNPAMIAVGRAAAEREGLRIEWHEGRAEKLPFPERTFDLVLCPQGLQFIPEPAAALGEMHRVLRDGGRVALSVWRGLDFHPFFATFNDALVRQIGIPALASPFSLGDAGRVCDLLTTAGFDSPVVDTKSMTARFPDPDEFIAMEIDVIAAAIPSVQHLDARAREALRAAIADELRAPIRAITHDEHIVIPMHAHIVRAYRRAA